MREPKPSSPRGYRFRAGIPAELHDRGIDYPCDAHDLSRSGVLLVGSFPLPAGDVVDLTLKSTAGDLSARFRGRRVRLERDEGRGGHLQLGVEFVDVADDARRVLESLLSRVISGRQPGPLERLAPGASGDEVRRALDEIPPAHRISLASRVSSPGEREVYLLDRNPAVLDALARNPHLLAQEARAIVSSHHAPPSSLERLARDPRFLRDDEMRMAIVTHPNAPAALQASIVDALPPATLRRLVSRPALSGALRQSILKKLRPKR